jgi:GrpB-like predicted nucleotidyltransferase (UPF0157 family)
VSGRPALRLADDLQDAARDLLAAEHARLAPLLPAHDLRHTGGSSVPGALTRGDIDLHLRVAPADFATTVARLREVYPVVHPEIWQATLATFTVPAALPAGLAVTPAGSVHDVRFTRCWQLLAADPALLAGYNAMKRAAGDDYEQRKSAFFDRLLDLPVEDDR